MKVALCCRNLEDGERIVNSLLSVNRENVRVQKLDLADLDSVELAVDEIIENEGHIDLLLNNAGVMAIPQKKQTVQNFEYQLSNNEQHVKGFAPGYWEKVDGAQFVAVKDSSKISSFDTSYIKYPSHEFK